MPSLIARGLSPAVGTPAELRAGARISIRPLSWGLIHEMQVGPSADRHGATARRDFSTASARVAEPHPHPAVPILPRRRPRTGPLQSVAGRRRLQGQSAQNPAEASGSGSFRPDGPRG